MPIVQLLKLVQLPVDIAARGLPCITIYHSVLTKTNKTQYTRRNLPRHVFYVFLDHLQLGFWNLSPLLQVPITPLFLFFFFTTVTVRGVRNFALAQKFAVGHHVGAAGVYVSIWPLWCCMGGGGLSRFRFLRRCGIGCVDSLSGLVDWLLVIILTLMDTAEWPE